MLTTTSLPPTVATTATTILTSTGPERKKVIAGDSNPDTAIRLEFSLTKEGKPRKRDPVDPNRCIFSCDSCSKAFTTKFNLKRHINLHCNKSKEAGVPVQGPPSASMPSRKAKERREAEAVAGLTSTQPKSPKKKANKVTKSRAVKTVKSKTFSSSSTSVSAPTTVSTTTTTTPMNVSVGQQQQQQQMVSTTKPLPSFRSSSESLHQTTYPHPNLQQQQQQVVGVLPHPQPIPQQPQQQQRVIQQTNTNSFLTLPDTNLQMSLSMQQQQQQPRQFFPQRIVRFIHPQQMSQRLPQHATAIVGQGPFVQHRAGVFQAIPVSIVSTTGPRGTVSRTIQLPQQPIPVLHTGQFKPVQTTPTTTSISTTPNGHLLAANVTSFMPNFATNTVPTHQRTFVQQPANEIYIQTAQTTATTSSSHTPTSILTSSTYIPMPNASSVTLDGSEMSCPPEEIFESEDGDAANDANNLTTSAVKSLPSISSITDKANDVQGILRNDPSGSDVNVMLMFATPNVETSDAAQNSSLNLPTNLPRGALQEIPRGWVRKLVTTGKGPKIFYYNTMGKKFSNADEINQYFLRLGQSVKPGLFNFEPSKFSEDSSGNCLNVKTNLESRQQQQPQPQQMQTVLN